MNSAGSMPPETIDRAVEATLQLTRLLSTYTPSLQGVMSRCERNQATAGEMLEDFRKLGAGRAADGSDAPRSQLDFIYEKSLKYRADVHICARQLTEPFTLFILGMGNYGKSTLVNALLGKRVAPVDLLPKTWKIDLYKPTAGKELAIVSTSDGGEKTLDLQSAMRLVEGEEGKRVESERRLMNEFREKAVRLPVEERERLLEYLRERHLYASPVIQVEWHVRVAGPLRDFVVVDTPGLFQRLERRILAGLEEYYHKADGVLWLLDGTAISAGGSRSLLEDIAASQQRLGSRLTNIIGVVNRMDLVERQGDGAAHRVLTEAAQVFSGYFSTLVPLSAERAWRTISSGRDLATADEQFRTLVDLIHTKFRARARWVKYSARSESIRTLSEAHAGECAEVTDRLAKGQKRMRSAEEGASRRLGEWRGAAVRRVADLVAENKAEVLKRCDTRLGEILKQVASAKDLTGPQRNERIAQRVTAEIVREGDFKAALDREAKACSGRLSALRTELLRSADMRRFGAFETDARVAVRSNVSLSHAGVDEAFTDGHVALGVGGVAVGVAAALLFSNPLGLIVGAVAAFSGVLDGLARHFQVAKIKDQVEKALSGQVEQIEQTFTADAERQEQQVLGEVREWLCDTFTQEYVAPMSCGSLSDALAKGQRLRVSHAELRPLGVSMLQDAGRRVRKEVG